VGQGLAGVSLSGALCFREGDRSEEEVRRKPGLYTVLPTRRRSGRGRHAAVLDAADGDEGECILICERALSFVK